MTTNPYDDSLNEDFETPEYYDEEPEFIFEDEYVWEPSCAMDCELCGCHGDCPDCDTEGEYNYEDEESYGDG